MFGTDLTWLGWIFVIDLALSVPIHLWRGLNGDYTRKGFESILMAAFTVLYIVGFFTVGFVE